LKSPLPKTDVQGSSHLIDWQFICSHNLPQETTKSTNFLQRSSKKANMKISRQLLSASSILVLVSIMSAAAAAGGRGLGSSNNECDGVDAGDNIQILSTAAATPTDNTMILALFQSMLGGIDNGNNPSALTGFRRVNWDAPIVPFDTPGNFFVSTVDRGMTVASDSGEFRVSDPTPNPSNDLKFSSINAEASADFTTFSAPRLFSPLDNNVFDVTFSIPGTAGVNDGATVSGFGAFFTDVDFDSTTKIALFDKNDCLLAERYVEPFPNGLSFLGIKLSTKIVAKVVVTLGNAVLNSGPESDRRSLRTLFGGRKDEEKDIVVLDDFLFDEPTPSAR
jgi:hypothetical protein